jgi:hypothetical protein
MRVSRTLLSCRMSDAVSTLHALPLVCCRGAALHHQPTRVAQIIPAVVTNHARNFGADGIQPLLDSLPTRNATTAIVEAVLAKYHPGAEFGVTSQHTSNSTGLTHVYASATSPADCCSCTHELLPMAATSVSESLSCLWRMPTPTYAIAHRICEREP